MKVRNYGYIFAVFLSMLLLTSCMPGGGSNNAAHPAGFFMGIWHGWIAPISLLWSIFFDHSVRIYEIYNTGWWYDFGFYIAIIGGFGGFSLARRRKNENR